ncbi:hypothetical protein BJV78DRAFT_895401 [Lactifluus subvellereus]|nr:hypothetical protein BJV78DRAFT_895401 [Lactifluus subvellereus]
MPSTTRLLFSAHHAGLYAMTTHSLSLFPPPCLSTRLPNCRRSRRQTIWYKPTVRPYRRSINSLRGCRISRARTISAAPAGPQVHQLPRCSPSESAKCSSSRMIQSCISRGQRDVRPLASKSPGRPCVTGRRALVPFILYRNMPRWNCPPRGAVIYEWDSYRKIPGRIALRLVAMAQHGVTSTRLRRSCTVVSPQQFLSRRAAFGEQLHNYQ